MEEELIRSRIKRKLKMSSTLKKNSVIIGGKTHYQFKPAELKNID